MILTGERLSFAYPGGRRVLDGVSMSIARGEIVGLSAPSGFGKTTLLKILAGYVRPDAGNVLLDGKPILSHSGYCPIQMIWQHPELVVNPRLRMSRTINEAGPPDARVLEGLGIDESWLNRYPIELSAGELQRFCIARALLNDVRFILADEITTMLDLVTQAQIWTFLIAEARQRDLGLLIVSHSDALLDRLCTRRIDMFRQA